MSRWPAAPTLSSPTADWVRLYEAAVRPLLFRLDPERAHELSMAGLAIAAPVAGRLVRPPRASGRLSRRLMGLDFPNPLGLAAGFDKRARAVGVWGALGFGFAEVGTVTAYPQPGNPRPRIVRLPADRALINRMGFNNDGALRTSARLRRRDPGRPGSVPLGVNLGKSKVTAAAEAPRDYAASLELLWPVADYVTVNVSSPNTPGLRDLQAIGPLRRILDALADVEGRMSAARGRESPPTLVKIAPDLADADVDAVIDLALERRLAGVIVANTSVGRHGLSSPAALVSEAGGLSGPPLRGRCLDLVRRAARRSGGRLVVVGVGGIAGADDVWDTLCAGADLVQAYTGFVYGGPLWPRRTCADLVARMDREGVRHVGELTAAGRTG
jgi:dihydroorotate dehydrogenase